ncbi:MAG: methylmalonyl-CoA mutase family protein, partial [Halanaerobium sp.]
KKKTVVGVNKYQTEEENSEIDLLKVDPALEKAQKEKLKKLKAERNEKSVQKSLKKVKSIAETENNLMPAIIAAVRARATLGEISDQLRKVFGEYQNRNI